MEALKTEAPAEAARVQLSQIAYTFLAIGLGSFSLAALGEAKEHVTRKRRWFTDEEYMQGLGLAQLLPGAPAVNLVSYLGYRLAGLTGAAAAALAFLFPCFVLMVLLSHLYLTHGSMPIVAGLFRGLAALVVGLVFNTVLNLWRAGVKGPFGWAMAMAGFALVFWLRMGIVRILLIATAASVLAVLVARKFPAAGRWAGAPSGDVAPAARGRSRMPGDAPSAGASACSRTPPRQGGRLAAAQLVWITLFLGLDLFVIHFRPELMQLGTRFLRIGALVFGSGYAMLPFIQDMAVNQLGWLTNEQFAVALALSLVTPGPVTIIGVFIGYKAAGLAGALVGMVNMYFPAWAMTAVAAGPYARAGRVGAVKQVTQGIVAAFIGTLLVVLIKLSSQTLVDLPAAGMAAAAFAAQRFGKIGTVWIVLAGALLSMVVFGA